MENTSIWTKFWDMHSGGGAKEDYELIYIEAPEEEAKVIFYNRFGHSPEKVTCTCCGQDYSIEDGELSQITGYHRGCKNDGIKYIEERCTRFGPAAFTPLEDYMKPGGHALFIKKEDIKDEERQGSVPKQGYVWVD
jgi:hypothetical protein